MSKTSCWNTTCFRRLSLPASLLEPIPNLEYWHYLDRPDMFAALSVALPRPCVSLLTLVFSINDSDDPFERMLAVLRFTFTKDIKFIVSNHVDASTAGIVVSTDYLAR